MLDWINALLDIFSDFCLWLLRAPFYGAITVGYVLIAIALMGVLFNFLVRRFK